MRELKFRTWFEDTNEVTEPWTIYDVSNRKDPNFGFTKKERFLAGTGGMAIGGIILVNERDHIIMQYTGIKDKTGKEIYEGDILQYKKSKRKFIVYWSEKYMMFCADFLNEERIPSFFRMLYSCETEISEIIGNIYENPELLKEKIHD